MEWVMEAPHKAVEAFEEPSKDLVEPCILHPTPIFSSIRLCRGQLANICVTDLIIFLVVDSVSQK